MDFDAGSEFVVNDVERGGEHIHTSYSARGLKVKTVFPGKVWNRLPGWVRIFTDKNNLVFEKPCGKIGFRL